MADNISQEIALCWFTVSHLKITVIITVFLISGSGKTAAFLVPIINCMLHDGCPRVEVSGILLIVAMLF